MYPYSTIKIPNLQQHPIPASTTNHRLSGQSYNFSNARAQTEGDEVNLNREYLEKDKNQPYRAKLHLGLTHTSNNYPIKKKQPSQTPYQQVFHSTSGSLNPQYLSISEKRREADTKVYGNASLGFEAYANEFVKPAISCNSHNKHNILQSNASTINPHDFQPSGDKKQVYPNNHKFTDSEFRNNPSELSNKNYISGSSSNTGINNQLGKIGSNSNSNMTGGKQPLHLQPRDSKNKIGFAGTGYNFYTVSKKDESNKIITQEQHRDTHIGNYKYYKQISNNNSGNAWMLSKNQVKQPVFHKHYRKVQTEADEPKYDVPQLSLYMRYFIWLWSTKNFYSSILSNNREGGSYLKSNNSQLQQTDVTPQIPSRHKTQNNNSNIFTSLSNSGEQDYRVDEVVGKGTFGVVYKATHKETGQVVAIKKVLQDRRYKNRELMILKMLHHPNVLQMLGSFTTTQNNEEYLSVVMEYFEETLYSLNQKYIKNLSNVPPILVKIYAYQMFRALHYLSLLSVAHRDIKPHNILISPSTNKLIICDFGSAKQLVKGQTNIAAPELIFGATGYTSQIDMWSVGCVIIELVNGEPPFLGDSQLDQLVQIIKILGTPSKEQVLGMNRNYDMKEYKFPNIKPKEWRKILKGKTQPLLVDLINEIMVYEPSRRLNPFEALCHPYFQELRTESKFRELQQKLKLPDLFNFTKEQLQSSNQFQKLLPSWYRKS